MITGGGKRSGDEGCIGKEREGEESWAIEGGEESGGGEGWVIAGGEKRSGEEGWVGERMPSTSCDDQLP